MSKRTLVKWWWLSMLIVVAAQAQVAETWVEHDLVECADDQRIYPETVSGGTTDEEVDGDTSLGAAENTDGDAVYPFVFQAASSSNLSDGGIVHLPMAGPYRETTTITITQNATVRGYTDADSIITTDCVASPPSAAFTISIGTGEVVVLENLTIRGFATAIDASGSTSGSLLILRNCVLEGNTAGIVGNDGAPAVRVHDSRIVDGGIGIRYVENLVLDGSEVSGQSTVGIHATSALDWRIHGSRIHDNATGLSTGGVGTGTASVSLVDSEVLRNDSHGLSLDNPVVALTMNRSLVAENDGDGLRLIGRNGSVFAIADSFIERNGDDGVYVKNGSGCGSVDADPFEGVLLHSRIVQNLDDGIEIEGSGTGCTLGQVSALVQCGLLRDTISLNGDYGLVETSAGSSVFHCGVGENQVSYNGSGAELNTGTACTASGTPANQVN